MGIIRPMNLYDTFRAALRRRNIGHIDIRWVSAKETLLPHLHQYLSVTPSEDSKNSASVIHGIRVVEISVHGSYVSSVGQRRESLFVKLLNV